MLLGGQRIRDERNKRGQTAGYRSTGSEPSGSARRKIDSRYGNKLNKIRNAFIHDRPHFQQASHFFTYTG